MGYESIHLLDLGMKNFKVSTEHLPLGPCTAKST